MVADEEWREVFGWPGYEVSSHGRVRSRKGRLPRFLKPTPTSHGHLRVTLSKGAFAALKHVHVLVAEAFIGPKPAGMQVRHFPDCDPSNNRVDNLSYGTAQQNADDRAIHGHNAAGERNGRARLTADQVFQIRTNKGWMTARSMAEAFGLNRQHVIAIWSGRFWRAA